jgi:hypothetical protein
MAPPRELLAARRESTAATRESVAPPRESPVPRERVEGRPSQAPRESLAPREEPRRRTSTPPRSAPRETLERAEGHPSAIRRTRADDPVVLDSEPGAFIFGSWRNVFIGIWESQATMAAVDRMVKATDAMTELHPTGRSTIHIVVHGAGLPSSEVRTHFVDVLKKNADQIACVAVVVGGTGFWTSALRSFVTGLRWLAPRTFHFRMFTTIEEVSRWLPDEHNKRTGIEIDPKQLVKVVDAWAAPRRRR